MSLTEPSEDDFPVSESWCNEIKRRCQEMDEEKVQTVPAEEAIAKLRQSLE